MAYHSTTLRSKKNKLTLEELHLNNDVRAKINQLLEEFTYKDALDKLDIPVDNKILLHGHTGCGKTATAHAIGLALNKKVITINLSGFVSSKLGETAKNLAEIFKEATIDNAIIFIDEFDFIGKLRDYDEKDSGEMKRLVNALIQQIDHLDDDTLLICATNHIHIIDSAILRRFQIKLHYELPTQQALDDYYDSILLKYPSNINNVVRTYGISYAEAKDLALQQIKANAIQYEKQKKHLLFVHQGLKPADDKLIKTADSLSGYKLHQLTIQNSSNPTKIIIDDYFTIKKSTDKGDSVEGFIIEVTGERLSQMDKDNLAHSKRLLETTNSGTEVWIYVYINE